MTIPGKGFRIPRIAEIMKLRCDFYRYQDGKLWYGIYYTTVGELPEQLKNSATDWTVSDAWSFEFPIPVEDAGAGEFEPEMPAITLLRWIRKHIEYLRDAVESESDAG